MIRQLAAFLMLSLLGLTPAKAVDAVSVTPGITYIDGNGAALLTLRWTIEIITSTPPPNPITVSSPVGIVSVGAQTIPSGGLITRQVKLKTGSNIIRITERVRINATAARLIAEVGLGDYDRDWTDIVSGSVPGGIVIEHRSSGSGGLSLRNLALSFDDQSSYRIVGQGEALTAIVKITTSGRGVVDGVWEIAGPNGGFRPIKRLRFSAAGPRSTEIESPVLPTDRPGQYRLRFRLGDGDGPSDPVITYVVGAGAAPEALSLTAPESGAVLTGATRFAWVQVNGAARYRLEFLVPGSGTPLAGVEVAGTEATVKPFTLSRLDKGVSLAWRITAFDAGGAVIARSPERLLGTGGGFVTGSP